MNKQPTREEFHGEHGVPSIPLRDALGTVTS